MPANKNNSKHSAKKTKQPVPHDITPPDLQIDNKNLALIQQAQPKYEITEQKPIKTRPIYQYLSSKKDHTALAELKNKLNIKLSISIETAYKNVFLKQFKKYTNMSHAERTHYLAKVLWAKETVVRIIENYSEADQLSFLYEMAVICQEAKEFSQALRHLNNILAICQHQVSLQQLTTEEIIEKEWQATLLLLEMQRNCSYVRDAEVFTTRALSYIEQHPARLTEKSRLLVNIALSKANAFEVSKRNVKNLLDLIEIYYYFRQSFIYQQANYQLPDELLYKDNIYLNIIETANGLSRLIMHLLNYDYLQIPLEQRLLACKTALNVLAFKAEVDNYINNNNEIKAILTNKKLQQHDSIEKYIKQKIAALKTIMYKSTADKVTNKSTSSSYSATLTAITVHAPQTNIDITTSGSVPLNSIESNNNAAISINEHAIKMLNEATIELLSKNLEKAGEIYNSLLKESPNFDATIQIYILLGNADFNSTMGVHHANKVDLDLRFKKAEPISDDDIENTRLANLCFYKGIDFCKQARDLPGKLPDIQQGDLPIAEEMSLENLRKHLASLDNMQTKYHHKMLALKKDLMQKGLWKPKPEEQRSLVAINLRKWRSQKKYTRKLKTQINNFECKLFKNNTHLYTAKPLIDNPPTIIQADELTTRDKKQLVGYLYPIKVEYQLTTNISNTVIGYIFPAHVSYISYDEPFEFKCSSGNFYPLTNTYYPAYSLPELHGAATLLPIDILLEPEQDIKNMSLKFTNNSNLFFNTASDNIKTRRHSFNTMNFSAPAINLFFNANPVNIKTGHRGLDAMDLPVSSSIKVPADRTNITRPRTS